MSSVNLWFWTPFCFTRNSTNTVLLVHIVDSDTFFPDLHFFAQFSRHTVGVPIVHHKPLWQATTKSPQRRGAHMKKGSSFQLIIIQPQNRGGGGDINIMSPTFKIVGGGGRRVPLSPPPPRFAPMILTNNFVTIDLHFSLAPPPPVTHDIETTRYVTCRPTSHVTNFKSPNTCITSNLFVT